MWKLFKSSKLILVLIVALAFFIRIYHVADNPPALSWDEISHGYNAYSILKTGQDEWGQFLPLANFRAYGDYPLPLYLYLTIPSIVVFGLNAFAIRLISVIFGTLLVILSYFLAKQFLKKEAISLLVSLMVALSPWTILTSRQVLQATPAVFLFSLGIWLFLLKKTEPVFKILGTISLGLSAYAYHNTRILAPLFFILLLFFCRQTIIKNKHLAISLIIVGGIFFAPLGPILLSPTGSARSTWVGILDQGAINQINQSRGQSNLPMVVNKALFNKETYFVSKVFGNYLSYFSPNYLALNGGTQYQFSVPGFGILHLAELPFFYLGLIIIIFKTFKKNWLSLFLLLWLLLGLLPAAITRDPYQVVRSMAAIPAVYLIIGQGLLTSFNFAKRYSISGARLGIVVLLCLIVFESARYWTNLMTTYPINYSFAWQYGYEQVASYVKDNFNNYSEIAITKQYGEPHEFMLFYLKYDPASYRNDVNLVRYTAYDWWWVDSFSKFKFVNDEDIKLKTVFPKNTLLVTSPNNYPSNATFIERINFLDGKPAFDIVKI